MMKYHFANSQDHFTHVKYLTKLLCLRYNMMNPDKAIPGAALQMIYEGAALHDIGLISVPDELNSKKGPLTQEEKDLLRKHTVIGARIVDRMAGLCKLTEKERMILHNICLYHHERYDGTGYPEGMKGDAIPLPAQIVSIAEVYDAMTRENYSRAHTHEEAINAILTGENGTFNPVLLECLKKVDADLLLLTDCASNKERIMLLESTYSGNRKHYWVKKRTFDIIVSSLALILLSPVMLLIALLIWVDDPKASPIFKQTRVGRHKKYFTMYKFRTMYKDAEERLRELEALNEKDGPVFKMANDPRITRVGRLLRKTSLDELPQLVNILKGDMTLVGPRPPLPREVVQYSRYSEMRLSVTPGLTCIWQVQPKRDDIRFDDWIDMDIAYIGTRSLRQDIKILLKTAKSVFTGSGE